MLTKIIFEAVFDKKRDFWTKFFLKIKTVKFSGNFFENENSWICEKNLLIKDYENKWFLFPSRRKIGNFGSKNPNYKNGNSSIPDLFLFVSS